MDIFDFIQKFFIVLLPGIIGFYFYETINIQREEHYYFIFLKIIVLSFASYLSTDLLFLILHYIIPGLLISPIDIIHQIGSDTAVIPTVNVVVAIILSLTMMCFLTKAEYENWLFAAANKLKITRRISNKGVWENVFDQNNIVVIRDYVTSNTYFGKVVFVSDDTENREIYLNDVQVYDKYSNFLYHADKFYISRKHNEFSVEIQNDSILEEIE